jgi:hypothetical protein
VVPQLLPLPPAAAAVLVTGRSWRRPAFFDGFVVGDWDSAHTRSMYLCSGCFVFE